jgi:UDPglucose--hexose-1-phosphate uridylyltransferase
MWLLPRAHASRYEEAPRHVFESLARMLKTVLIRIDRALESPPFNLIIHSSPMSEDTSAFFHWHMELMPRISRVAGFEWGSGFYINPTSPEEATEVLRAVRL